MQTLRNYSREQKKFGLVGKQISINKIKLDIPTRKKNITVRDILNENKNNKTDFMYSIILSELHLKALPNYIREGLIWLM